MKTYLIYTNEIDRAFGSYDEAERFAREALLEDHDEEEITDDMIWHWLYDSLDMDADDFWREVRSHSEGIWLVIADVGTWQGRYDGGKVFSDLSAALRAVCNDMDDITIEEDARGNVHATGRHHDGTDHYEIYRLSPRGEAWYQASEMYTDRRTLCETLAKPHNRRAGRIRKALGWVA